MRSPSQGTPARRDHAPHYIRGERLLGGSRLVGEIENGVGSPSHCSPQTPQGSAQASKACSQLCTRAACPDPRRIREAHRSSRTRHAGDAEPTRHGGRDVLRGVNSTSHTSPTLASRLALGRAPPRVASCRLRPAPPGSPSASSSLTRRSLEFPSPTDGWGEGLPRCCAQASLPEPRFVKRSWPSE